MTTRLHHACFRHVRAATLAGVLAPLLAGGLAAQERPLAYCSKNHNDNMLRSLSPELLREGAAAMGVPLPPNHQIRGVWRCMDGKVMYCIAGAERHCGRADAQVVPSPEATQYCAAHPDANDLPTYTTGRDTIFGWTCKGVTPTITGAVRSVDARGFVREYWRMYEPQAKNP